MHPAPPERRCPLLIVGSGRAAHAAARRAGPHALRLDEHAVWGAFAPTEIAAVEDGATVLLRPDTLLLAPRAVALPWPVPGWALPGIGTLDTPPPGTGPLILAGMAPGIVRLALALLAAGEPPAAVAPHRIAGRDRRRLRRAGIPLFPGATPLRAEGQGRFDHLVLAWRGRVLRLRGTRCILHGGWAPETGLARALGARHEVLAPGVLRTVTDAAGRTSLPGISAIPAPSARYPRPNPAAFTDTDVVCPCETVTAGALRTAIRHGAASLPAVKRATRAGMGRCQARRCGPTLHAFCGGPTEAHGLAPRAPIHPTPIGPMAHPTPVPPADATAHPTATRWVTAAPAPSVPPACDVLVIGAGILGLSAARHLARAGRDVLLLDRNEPGLGASTANAGSLHVQLLPYAFDDGAPGPLAEALALGPRSIALWRALAAEAGEPLGLRTEGGLILAETTQDLAWLTRKAAFERAQGIPTAIIGPAELASLAPALARTYAGAAFCPEEGQVDPLRGTAALLRLTRAAGVRIHPGTAVLGLEPRGPAWHVATAAGPVRANQVLNAAGAHAPTVAAAAGLALPVRAVVQQVIATAPAPAMLRQLVAQARTNLSLKQGDAGHLLIGGGWPGRLGPDGATRLLRESVQGNLATALRAMPALGGIEAVRAWTGLTVHLDRGPVIAETPGRPGLFHAVTANGYTLGPEVGRMVAEAMLNRERLPASFALTR